MAGVSKADPKLGSETSLIVSVEDAPLLRSQEQRRNGEIEDEDENDEDDKSFFNCSATTNIGLLLLLIMIILTVLSIVLQRYSSNKYIDIITPVNGSTNGTVDTDILNF